MLARHTTVTTTIAIAALAVAAFSILPGCAVTRGQETVGEYIDDTSITTRVKARMIEDKTVDASAISVETMDGTVMLSGFAKNSTERTNAEGIARNIKGVKAVKNQIAIRN